MGRRTALPGPRPPRQRQDDLRLRAHGWCQPGSNLPATLSSTGSHFHTQSTNAASETDRWSKEMWLSNRDFCQLFQRAIEADASTWPDGSITVHGMSDNAGMRWNIGATHHYLGYQPQDDVYAD